MALMERRCADVREARKTFAASSPERAAKHWKHWINKAEHKVYGNKLGRIEQLPWVRVIENHKDQRLHVHAIVAGVQDLDPQEFLDNWKRHSGSEVRLDPYDDSDGMNRGFRYILKHADNGADVLPSLPALRISN